MTRDQLIQQIAFYAGQTGLLAAAVCSLGIVHITSQSVTRPPGYYYICVWLVGAACAFVFGSGFVSDQAEYLPTMAYGLRFLFGVERTAVLGFYWFHKGEQWPQTTIRRVNTYVGFVTTIGVAVMVCYGFYSSNQENLAATKELVKEVKAERPADSLLVRKLRAQIASQTTELTAARHQIAELTQQSIRQGEQIQQLTALTNQLIGLVDGLKKAVYRVNANVERTRKTTAPVPPVLPAPPSYWVDPNKVRKNTY